MVFRLSDMHVHSSYSFDSLMEPREILERACRVGLERVAITDHGTIEGALEAKELATNEFGVEVIVGEEIGTNVGDIIGLNLTERIPSGRKMGWKLVLEEINSQGGISVLPHPFRDHKESLMYKVAVEIDVVENWNSRSTLEQNAEALMLVADCGKPHFTGSDAHFPGEIGNVMTYTDLETLDTMMFWELPSSRKYTWGSHVIKFLKNRGIISR